jgi:hypothetical protein
VTSEVAVDAALAYATPGTTDKTFGPNTATLYKGPVGMFVGYADDATLKNCSSTVTDNVTFQFLGKAAISTVAFENSLWKSDAKYDTEVKAYSDSLADGVYTAFSPAGVKMASTTGTTYVGVNLEACKFHLNGERQQIHGFNEYYYSMSEEAHQQYTVAASTDAVNVSNTKVTFTSKDESSSPRDTGMYYLSNGRYYRAYIKYVEKKNSWGITNDRRFYIVDAAGNELANKEGNYNWRVYYDAEFTCT